MTNDWPEGQQPRENGCATLAAALAKAQAEMSNPGFDSQNPHFRSRFASLASVRNAVVPVLAKHGICLTQDILTTESGISCTTTLSHGSGQQMVFGPLVLPAAQTTAQGFGSAATYARRYQLMAVAAVAGDDDDDAEAAVGRGNGNGQQMAHGTAQLDGERLSPQKRDQYLPEIAKYIASEDNMGLRQLWDELSENEQAGIWSLLNSKQKSTARGLLQTTKP